MKNVYILTLSHLLLVNLFQFQRSKSGDILGNQTCRNGTYVVRQAEEVDSIQRMEQADCNWNFDSPDPDLIGFIPNEPSNMITFKVRLLKNNRPSTNVTCANHTAGNIAVQNVNANKSVWDTDIGNDIIRKTLTYQFNQTDGTVIIGFTKHWDGFLLKIFINCLDESGRNIAAHSTTRCVMVKYEGNVKYPINGLSPLKTTSSTFFTQATSKKIFGTEITITPAPPSTSTSTTTAPSITELTKALAPTLTDISTTLNMATTQPLPLITTAAVPQTYTAASATEATKRTPTTPTDISAATSMVTTRPSSTKTAAAPPKNTAASTTEATKPTPITLTDISAATNMATTIPSLTTTAAAPPKNTAASTTEATKPTATTLTDISAATNMATTTPSLTTTTAAPPTNTAALTTKATKPTATTPTGISTASTMATTPPLSLSATTTAAPPTNTAASTTEATKSLAPPPSPTKKTATTKAPNVGSVGDNNKDEDTLVLVIAIVGGVVALLPIIIFLLLIWYKRKKTRKYETGKSEQEMNGLSNPAFDADGDVLHSTRVFNEDQACEEVETCHDEMSEYAVVNKTTEASTNNGMIVIETKNPPDEQDMFSDAINKESDDFHKNSKAVSVPTPVLSDDYAVLYKSKRLSGKNTDTFS
ncbi:uncharacterized protein LOC130625717 isoform X2 [Hydractinia symbiolongicarpus]|uniref:uncharacterized protein LOC130625717 isoform X2 n=1 Tax=Hydractinia symbiolongicarpus TaxID=13093 RepID=UPI00254D6F8E|nr:uncharacterized protein LOC130625717 isoform X2 [Hydractinia symbiolongicarpus]